MIYIYIYNYYIYIYYTFSVGERKLTEITTSRCHDLLESLLFLFILRSSPWVTAVGQLYPHIPLKFSDG